jgi:hypothetical protein
MFYFLMIVISFIILIHQSYNLQRPWFNNLINHNIAFTSLINFTITEWFRLNIHEPLHFHRPHLCPNIKRSLIMIDRVLYKYIRHSLFLNGWVIVYKDHSLAFLDIQILWTWWSSKSQYFTKFNFSNANSHFIWYLIQYLLNIIMSLIYFIVQSFQWVLYNLSLWSACDCIMMHHQT